jgi:hypothetical protein
VSWECPFARRRQCEGASETRLEKVTERLAADVPGMERPGADLIAYYLDPDRLPVTKRPPGLHPLGA